MLIIFHLFLPSNGVSLCVVRTAYSRSSSSSCSSEVGGGEGIAVAGLRHRAVDAIDGVSDVADSVQALVLQLLAKQQVNTAPARLFYAFT